MPRPEPGRWPWLLAHELRLLWRTYGLRSWLTGLFAAAFLAATHFAMYVAMRQGVLHAMPERVPGAAIVLTGLTLLLVASAAFALAVRALFERSDLDLVLSAPVSARHVFAARGIAVAAGAVAALALVVLPLAHAGPFTGHWGALAAYPVLAAVGLACVSLAFAVTLVLVRWLGVRRARIWAQVLGAVVGAAIVLGMQVHSLLPRGARRALEGWAGEGASSWLGATSPLLWPWRAMLGEPGPLAIVLAVGIAAYAAVVWWGGPAFVRAVQDAPAAVAPGPRSRRGELRFRGGAAAVVIRKELRVLLRDPMLLGKALLQVLYLVPLFLAMLRESRQPALLAAAVVVVAANLATTFGLIVVGGEEAPDLLGSAPVARGRIRMLKVAAALVPVAILVLPLLAWLAVRDPANALVLAPFLAAAVVSSAMVHVWATPLGGSGRELKPRGARDIGLRFVDLFASFGWAGAAYLAMTGSWWWLAPVPLGLAGPLAALVLGRAGRALP